MALKERQQEHEYLQATLTSSLKEQDSAYKAEIDEVKQALAKAHTELEQVRTEAGEQADAMRASVKTELAGVAAEHDAAQQAVAEQEAAWRAQEEEGFF